MAIRAYRATRHVPLIFVGGDPEKVARIRKQLPDAVYTNWDKIRSSLEHAITHPPLVRIVPRSSLEGYANVALPKKLGIKAGSVVVLVSPPPGFKKTLGELPKGVVLRKDRRDRCDGAIWFTRSRKDLERHIHQMVPLADNGGLWIAWIAWPKKTSRTPADLSQAVVRKVALAAGIVDYKVCVIDATCSGLRFARRKSK